MSNTQEFQYERRALYADYARAAIGIALTFGPVLFLQPLFWVSVVFSLVGLLFVALALQTVVKQYSTVTVTPSGMALTGPINRSVAWDGIVRVKLKFFAKRRKQREGWMQLTVHDGSTRITVDSTLDGFSSLIRKIAETIRENRIDVDPTTTENFLALGVRIDDPHANGSLRGNREDD